MAEPKKKKEARKCPYYGCAGTMVCTYYPWTTTCAYPNCNKPDLWNGGNIYENLKKL